VSSGVRVRLPPGARSEAGNHGRSGLRVPGGSLVPARRSSWKVNRPGRRAPLLVDAALGADTPPSPACSHRAGEPTWRVSPPGRAGAGRCGQALDTGMVWINSPQGSAADLPFGGTKRSGVGRELGPLGIDEFVNNKLVYTPAG
jgi:Aldehyde dehydrogenase family